MLNLRLGKLILVLPFFIYLHAQGQKSYPIRHPDRMFCLIADQNIRLHVYYEGRPLKIFYKKNDSTFKATGKLYIDSTDNIKLIKHNGSKIVSISPENIISIRGWSKNNLILAGAFAGAGALIVITASNGNYSLGHALLIASLFGGTLFVTEVNLIIVLAKEWLSVRSIKNGYKFYVRKIAG
ncbi:MAG TPA: hypothetical protein VMU83_11260 [Hanamia sp.]|nr:hypothetical protein [Hanamia sp.]